MIDLFAIARSYARWCPELVTITPGIVQATKNKHTVYIHGTEVPYPVRYHILICGMGLGVLLKDCMRVKRVALSVSCVVCTHACTLKDHNKNRLVPSYCND